MSEKQEKGHGGRPFKPDRKQRINVTLHPSTLAVLDERSGNHSKLIETLLRQYFGLSPLEERN